MKETDNYLSIGEVKRMANAVKGARDCRCGSCLSHYEEVRTEQMGKPADFQPPKREVVKKDNVIWRNEGKITKI